MEENVSYCFYFGPDADARPQDLQAAFWEQAPQVPDACWAGGCSGLKRCRIEELNRGKRLHAAAATAAAAAAAN